MLFATMEGEPDIISTWLRLTAIEGVALLEALAVVGAVRLRAFSPASGGL